MYSVSNAYITKLKSVSVKRRRIRGKLDNISFTEDDLLKDSFKYSDIAVSSADIKLGGVFIGSLSLTFLSSFIASNNIARGSWRGRTITGTIDLLLGLDANNQEVWESVPFKPYIIDEANHSSLGVSVKAYDAMSKMDKAIDMSTSSGSLYGFTVLACQSCGVPFGMTEADMYDFPNGDQILGLHPNNDIETWRDLISWIAVTCCSFATINRDGELVFRTWKQDADLTIEINNRFSGGSWSDFATRYTAITVKNIDDGTESYYSEDPDDGLTLTIGANPLLQYGVDQILEIQRRAILGGLQNLQYVPFKSVSLIDPCLDLGDVINYTNGLAGTSSKCCVMRIDFQFTKGATLQGFGKNPAQADARNATDKAVTGATKKASDQNIEYYTYINSNAYSLTTDFQKLFGIEFAVAEATTITLWQEIKALSELIDDTQSITYQYYFDGDPIAYQPIDTFGEDGYHTMPHPYWLMDVPAGASHTWEVWAKLDSGNATINIGDIHALMMGQKMVAQDAFKGELVLEDIYVPIEEEVEIVPITESFNLELIGEASDRLVVAGSYDYIVTTDGDNIVQAGGN